MSLTRDFAKGLLVGAGLGAASTLLLAPRSGAETRRAIADKKDQLKDQSSAKASEYRGRGQQALDKARETLGSTKEGLKEAGKTLAEPDTKKRPASVART